MPQACTHKKGAPPESKVLCPCLASSSNQKNGLTVSEACTGKACTHGIKDALLRRPADTSGRTSTHLRSMITPTTALPRCTRQACSQGWVNSARLQAAGALAFQHRTKGSTCSIAKGPKGICRLETCLALCVSWACVPVLAHAMHTCLCVALVFLCLEFYSRCKRMIV